MTARPVTHMPSGARQRHRAPSGKGLAKGQGGRGGPPGADGCGSHIMSGGSGGAGCATAAKAVTVRTSTSRTLRIEISRDSNPVAAPGLAASDRFRIRIRASRQCGLPPALGPAKRPFGGASD
jgi:hypothetical protein